MMVVAMAAAGKQDLEKIKRFDMPGFRPRPEYVREMKRFGVLPAEFDPAHDPIDVFRIDQEYWKQFWYYPDDERKWPYLD